jgi:hypothetical protein
MPKRRRGQTAAQKRAARENLEKARRARLSGRADATRARAISLRGGAQNKAFRKAFAFQNAALSGVKPRGKRRKR